MPVKQLAVQTTGAIIITVQPIGSFFNTEIFIFKGILKKYWVAPLIME